MKFQKKMYVYNYKINKNIFKKYEGRYIFEMDD